MSVLVDNNTKLMIQGITGKMGQTHTKRSLEEGVSLVAGVTPGKGGQTVHGVPVCDNVAEALNAHPAINASMILVPPVAVLEATREAIRAGIKLIVIITEFVPVLDSMKIYIEAKENRVKVVGPNTIGIISPGKSKIGVMPSYIYQPGHVGIISRSGTLTHEVASNMTFAGIGQSTCICIGGDPIAGMSFIDGLELMLEDSETLAIIVLGEIGGESEEEASEYLIRTKYPKPIFGYIVGKNAPQGKKMGHAGAIIANGKGTAQSKISCLKTACVKVAETTGNLLELIKEEDKKRGGALTTLSPINED